MIPSQNSPLWAKAKFAILENGDEILPTDEYYNPLKDKWLPVQKKFHYNTWHSDESKPVRRRAGKGFKNPATEAIRRLERILDADYYRPLPEQAAEEIIAVQIFINKNL